MCSVGLVLPVNGHWFGLGAGLSSQDKVALQEHPVDAMENWGVCLGQREGVQCSLGQQCPAILPE